MFAPVRAGLFAALFAFACVASSITVYSPPATAQTKARKAVPARRSRRRRDPARSPDQDRCRAGRRSPPRSLRREADAAFQKNDFRAGMQLLGQIVAVAPDDSASWLRLARSRPADPPGQRPRAHAAARARRDRRLHRLSAHRQSAPRRPTRCRSSAAPSPSARCGGRRSMRCGCRSNCAKSPTCARSMRGCATSTASACSTTPSMPMRPRRAPASSSPRRCRAGAPISRRSSRSPGRTSRRSRPTRSSSASKA